MAVISTASEELTFLRGLYATFSITTPRIVQAIIAIMMLTIGLRPAFFMQRNTTYAPTMIMSP